MKILKSKSGQKSRVGQKIIGKICYLPINFRMKVFGNSEFLLFYRIKSNSDCRSSYHVTWTMHFLSVIRRNNDQFLNIGRWLDFCCHCSADKLATVRTVLVFVAINWIYLEYYEASDVTWSLTNRIKSPKRIPLPNKPKTWNLFYAW